MGGVSKNEEFLKHLEENFEPEIPHPNFNKKHKVLFIYTLRCGIININHERSQEDFHNISYMRCQKFLREKLQATKIHITLVNLIFIVTQQQVKAMFQKSTYFKM